MLENNTNKELIEKLISVIRVSKVVKGGRRFGFAALVVSGDGQGRVGFGSGKAKEVPEAIRKASEEAKKTMVRIPLREGRTIHHDIKAKFSSSTVILRSAPKGTVSFQVAPQEQFLKHWAFLMLYQRLLVQKTLIILFDLLLRL